MSELSRRIQDRTPIRPPVLDRHDAERVESRLLSYEQARYETAMRLRIENALLREQGQRLASDNAALAVRIEDLEAQNATLSATTQAATNRASHEHERLIVAEQGHTLWLAGLAVATLATVIVAISMIR